MIVMLRRALLAKCSERQEDSMNRLMRAEWYRVRKTYHLSVWAVALCVFMIYLGYMDVGFDSASSGVEAFGMFLEKDLLLMTYLPLIIAGMYVTSYENKVLCYEVMAGNRTSRLLLSKLFTVVPLMSVISITLMVSPILYFGEKNGYGNTEHIALRILIVAVICIRVLSCSVLIMTTFKSAVGMFVVFLRFLILEAFGSLMIDMVTEGGGTVSKVTYCLVGGGLTCSGLPDIASQDVIICVAAGVVEILIWYVLSYNSYEKKWFN